MKRLAITFALACCVAMALPTMPAYARSATKLKASISKSTCTYNSPANFTATLRNSSGHVLAKKTLVLKRDGVRVGSYKTNGKGVVTRRVKYLGTAHWQYVFAGDSRYKGSASATRTTDAMKVLEGTYAGAQQSDGTYSISLTFHLAKGHIYALITDHPAVYFLGSVANYENANQLTKDTSGTRSQLTFKAPWSTEYWAEWDWGGGLNDVSSTGIHVVVW
jgi:hypothetical protein